jgi:MFS family permease
MFYHKTRTMSMPGSLGFGVGRQLWLVQVGVFVNALGWGAVLPFEIIYLHDARGFGLGVAGLVVGTITGVAVVAAPLAGWWIDRLGARSCASGGGLALAAGYAGLAVARTPGVAFAVAALAGAGNGLVLPSQSALIATLAPARLRHRASAISRVATNAGFGLGGALGGFVAAEGLHGLVALFLANAASYVVFVLVLRVVVPADASIARPAGGYRDVLRDRAFVRLALANAVVIAVGWGALPWLVPPFAAHDTAWARG